MSTKNGRMVINNIEIIYFNIDGKWVISCPGATARYDDSLYTLNEAIDHFID